MSGRVAVVTGDGIALVEQVDADAEAFTGFDGLFDVDKDPRDLPVRQPVAG